ncbi:MAG: Tat pathway signal protein [Verrucomicrobiota bacterium]|jgi:uncharacterized lipoprotein YddW (UPF0748 family)
MNRRAFIAKVGQGALGISAASAVLAERPGSAAVPMPPPKNWIWTGGGENLEPDEQKKRFEKFREAEIHAVLFSGFNADVLARAKAQGLETHAWTWALCRSDKELLENHPEWYDVSRRGDSAAGKPPYINYYHFLCPSRHEVREYLARIVADLGDTANLDGIHLDYIRYPDVILPVALWKKYNLIQNEELPEFDFCYCEVCRSAFKQQTGEDPLKLPDPSANLAWRRYRYDSVTELVNHLAKVAHGKGKQITAAVFPTPKLAKKLVRQDWVRWNLDAVLPMTYHSFYNEKPEWIERAVQEGVAALPANRPVYAGLYLPDLKGEDFDRAVQFAMTGGAKGVSLFGGLRTVRGSKPGTSERSLNRP